MKHVEFGDEAFERCRNSEQPPPDIDPWGLLWAVLLLVLVFVFVR